MHELYAEGVRSPAQRLPEHDGTWPEDLTNLKSPSYPMEWRWLGLAATQVSILLLSGQRLGYFGEVGHLLESWTAWRPGPKRCQMPRDEVPWNSWSVLSSKDANKDDPDGNQLCTTSGVICTSHNCRRFMPTNVVKRIRLNRMDYRWCILRIS